MLLHSFVLPSGQQGPSGKEDHSLNISPLTQDSFSCKLGLTEDEELSKLSSGASGFLGRVDQNCKDTPYMTVYLVTSLPKTPYIHRIYTIYIDGVLVNPSLRS
jgi:hypothetical protein